MRVAVYAALWTVGMVLISFVLVTLGVLAWLLSRWLAGVLG